MHLRKATALVGRTSARRTQFRRHCSGIPGSRFALATMGTFNLVRTVRVPFDRERVFPVWYLVLWIILVAAVIVNLVLGGSYDPFALAVYAAILAWSVLGHFVGQEKPLVHGHQRVLSARLIQRYGTATGFRSL